MSTRSPYSDERAMELLETYRCSRDPRLRDAIVEQMRPLVTSVARKFAGREPLEDLESEGYVGLIRAIDRFHPERGARLSTFAMHLVAGQIRHYLRDRGHLIRQPAWLQELSHRVQQAERDLEQRLGREPTLEELAGATNLTEEGLEELLTARHAARTLRLEAPHDADDYLEVDPEKFRSRDYLTLQLPVEDRIVVENAVRRLKELERKVIYYFFYQDFTQSEIARKLGISCNYAGHVLRNGLKHMREGLPAERAAAAGESDSVLDSLTGLYTRDHFRRRLAEELSRAQRSAGPLAVCCLRLPSTCGAEELLAAADLLSNRARRADVLARTGSLQLGMILPGTSEAAVRVVEALGARVQEQVDGPVLVGAARYPLHAATAERLLAAAEESLYPVSAPAVPVQPAVVVG